MVRRHRWLGAGLAAHPSRSAAFMLPVGVTIPQELAVRRENYIHWQVLLDMIH